MVASVAKDAEPAKGKRRVILLSHGLGGIAPIMGWLGAGLAGEGYIVISVDHPGNSDGDMSDVASIACGNAHATSLQPCTLWRTTPFFGALLDRGKIGAAGFSIGGMTAMALTGPRIDPENFDRFCLARPEDGVCQKPAERKD